jgi:hypothetical protein
LLAAVLIGSVKEVASYRDRIFAVHEVYKLHPTAFGKTTHLLIGDSSLARLLNRTESTKDVTRFLIADWATRDSGKIDGACRPVSERRNLWYGN